jgi:hypothetical protein
VPTLDFQTNGSGAITAWAIWAGTSTGYVLYSWYNDPAIASGLFGGTFAGENPQIDGASISLGAYQIGPSDLGNWTVSNSDVRPTPEPLLDAFILVAGLGAGPWWKKRQARRTRASGSPIPKLGDEDEEEPVGHLIAAMRRAGFEVL